MATEFSKFLKSMTKHAVAGSSKLEATINGHIWNLLTETDLDNGTIVARGDYVEPEVYKVADSTGFAGVIDEKAANGNWYVRVTAPGDGLLVLTVPTIYENYTRTLIDEANFYNEAGSRVRAYDLNVGDIFELSAEGISGTPAKGATVKVVNKKITIE